MTDPANDGPTALEVAETILRGAVLEYCMTAQVSGDSPLVCASEVLTTVVTQMIESMPEEIVRTALLMGFDRAHQKPLNFVQIGQATEALKHISNARKAVEKKTALILDHRGEPA